MINGGYLNDFNYFTDQKIISLLMSTNVRSELKTKCHQITEILFKKRIKFSAHHACSKSND